MVKYLAEKYPKLINSVDDDNDNGLHLAVRRGKMDIVVYLIEELKMDPAVEGKYGKNVFLQACNTGITEMIKYLKAVMDDECDETLDYYDISYGYDDTFW